MKVVKSNIIKSTNNPVKVVDCMVESGFMKVNHGSLPDIDSDFDASRRDEVKAYLERRYNKNGMNRVFSAGTFTTEKIKSVIKDVARTHKISQSITNYLTAILDRDDMTWTDFMKVACKEKKIRDFVEKYPDVFEEILPIMGQTRAAGIHASAIIVTPEVINNEKVECFDLLPIRKMNDLLVSEISGADIDAIGILKNDVLGIKELSRLSDMLNMIEVENGSKYTILEIASKYLYDQKVYDVIKEGNTQGIFQMSGEGITKYIKRMAPDNINDIIASVALFRPGPLDSGSAENYVRAKRGEYEPEYLWGTYELLNDTFGQMIYQEQISRVAQKIGSLSLGDGVNLVKALSKKKLEKVRKFQDKFFDGAKKNGCPKDAADKIWSDVEDAAKYSFNKCIRGTERIMRIAGAETKSITIADMYLIMNDLDWAKKHGKMSLRSKYLRLGYGKAWSLDSNCKLCKNYIVDIRYQGKRPVYRITLENGKTIDVTTNHKHPTRSGKKRTDELVPGVDEMYCYTDARNKIAILSQVHSVEYICDDDVYDVEMEDPMHTFVTGNGIVTCNSHATAYGLTSYVGAWIKTHYPTAFYTVVLRDQDSEKMAVLMNEIERVGGTKLEHPDINISGENFTADFKNNVIYWSLSRIKYLGPKAVQYIAQERKLYGEFCDMEDFIKRIFKSKFKNFDDDGTEEVRERCPVTARNVRNLIYSGAFDRCENVQSVIERYGLLEKAAVLLGFTLSESEVPEDMRDKHYFWSRKQIEVSGHGSIDYKRIYDNMEKPNSLKSYKLIELKDLYSLFYEERKGVVCATICSVSSKTYKDKRTGENKHFGKIEIQQNTETNILTIWDDWDSMKKELMSATGKIFSAVVSVKWSDYDEKNTLQIGKNTFFKLL